MEGVGGWAVPLTSALTVEDLAMSMKLPVIIVSANRLGMLNHTLLTVEAVREAGLTIAGIVVNNAMGPTSELQGWNIEDLRNWVGPETPITVLSELTSAPKTRVNRVRCVVLRVIGTGSYRVVYRRVLPKPIPPERPSAD